MRQAAARLGNRYFCSMNQMLAEQHKKVIRGGAAIHAELYEAGDAQKTHAREQHPGGNAGG
jgi:hypothetical protein